MSKLRLSAHPLRIETVRYCRLPLSPEQRICQFCNLDVVESEEHFLLECTLYNVKRDELWQAVGLYASLPDSVHLAKSDKFNLILSLNNGDTEVIEPVIKFVSECFALFK